MKNKKPSCDVSSSQSQVLLGTGEPFVPIHYCHCYLTEAIITLMSLVIITCRLLFLRAYILIILFSCVCISLPLYISRVSHRVFPLPDCQGARFKSPLSGPVYSPMCACVSGLTWCRCVPECVSIISYHFLSASLRIFEPPTLTLIIPL